MSKLGNDAESPSAPSSPTGSQTELIGHLVTAPGTVPPTGHVPLESTIGESNSHHVTESDSDHNFALTTSTVHDSITRVVALRLPWKIVPFVIGVFIIVEVSPFTEQCVHHVLTAPLPGSVRRRLDQSARHWSAPRCHARQRQVSTVHRTAHSLNTLDLITCAG